MNTWLGKEEGPIRSKLDTCERPVELFQGKNNHLRFHDRPVQKSHLIQYQTGNNAHFHASLHKDKQRVTCKQYT